MRPPVFRIHDLAANARAGRVRWAPLKSLWFNSCFLGFVLLVPFATTPASVVVFLITTYVSLLLGHSVGMHRKLIHQSYGCPTWLERCLVYIGVLVGMAGPMGLIRVHDVRDWAQRLPDCHDFFSHRAPLWLDAFWQLNCRFDFHAPPQIAIEDSIRCDPFYRFLEATWIAQQVPVALVLYWLGGLPWLVWGVFGRVAVSVAGHWIVTYYTHNPGPGSWLVPDAGVQASNLTGTGFVTMGECWHNNHHAFPESARIGLNQDEFDPGWLVISLLERVGLVWHVGLPRSEENREDLRRAP